MTFFELGFGMEGKKAAAGGGRGGKEKSWIHWSIETL